MGVIVWDMAGLLRGGWRRVRFDRMHTRTEREHLDRSDVRPPPLPGVRAGGDRRASPPAPGEGGRMPATVRRLLRVLLNAATALSLVLCVATAALWVRSYWRAHWVRFV